MKAILVGLMLVCASAHAKYQNGNSLLTELEGTPMDRTFALGYIIGAADVYNDGEALCIPLTVTQGQLQDVVFIYLKNSPQIRDMPANFLVFAALNLHWKCSTKSGKKKS